MFSERAHLVLGDWQAIHRRLAEAQTRMVAVLDALELTELVTSIDGLSAVGAAAILAETGDPHRFPGSACGGQARRVMPAGQHLWPAGG